MTIRLKPIIAAVAAVALLATGTFAFQQTITKTNEFIGQKEGVTLHDDFDPGTGLKDVYVENQGSGKVYVRVKLDETMDITNNQKVSDWRTHTPGEAAEDCGHSNAAGAKFHNYFTWTMGGSKWYMPTSGSSPIVQDIKEYNAGTPGAKQTPNAQITTAADFLAMSETAQKTFVGWIYDTDGYAYWSQPVLPGEATGLLLHRVDTASSLKYKNYYYAINVIVEVVNRADVPMWTDGDASVDGSGKTYSKATGDGEKVIWIIVGDDGEGGNGEPGVTILGGDKTIAIDETYTPAYTLTPAAISVIWASSDESVASVGQDGKITGVSEGGPVTITITVELENGNTYTDSIRVTVTDGNGGGGGETGLPVAKPSIFTPVYDGNPATSDGFYYQVNFGNHADDLIHHAGAIHLADIITDGNYENVTLANVPAKYTSSIKIGVCPQHGGPAILFSYEPTSQEWIDLLDQFGEIEDVMISVPLRLVREGQSADITINMIYPGSLVSI